MIRIHAVAVVVAATFITSSGTAQDKSPAIPAGWISGRMTEVASADGGLELVFNRGIAHGVLPGDKGYLVGGTKRGDFEIVRVTRTESTGFTKLMTIEEANATTRIAAIDAHRTCIVTTASPKVSDPNAAPPGYAFTAITSVTPTDSLSGLTDYRIRIDKGASAGVFPGAKLYITVGSTSTMAPFGYGEVLYAQKEDAGAIVSAGKGLDNQLRRAGVAISTCK